MTDISTAPVISTNRAGGAYPNSGEKIGPAWQTTWALLRAEPGFADGRELAAKVAEKHGVSVETVAHLLRRASVAGLLERDYRTATGTRGDRRKAFYRIPPVV